MNNLLSKFTPPDIIAVIVIVGGLILKFGGADGVVGTLLTVVCAYYFAKRERTVPLTDSGGGPYSNTAVADAKKR